MKIQTRLLLLMLSKTVFTMLIALLITAHLTRVALEHAAQEKLTAVMEARYSALTLLTKNLQAQVSMLAPAPTTIKTLQDFSNAFHNLGNQAQVLLQQQYLAAGSAYRSTALPPAFAEYDAIHQRIISYFAQRQAAYDWEDMFMVDTLGNVVFSLKKQSDFATNLRSGAWHDSGLARAVLPLLDNPIPLQLSFADYSQYAPSRLQAASFLAISVFNSEKQQFLGVVAIQLPIEKINELIMDKSGLGDTGEVIIVGKDAWMLSDSRFSKASTILKLQVKTKASAMVLAGKSGTLVAPDYRGIDIMATVKPFTPFPNALGDSKALWGVIVKIEHDEILSGYDSLQNALLLTTGGLVLLAMALALWGGRSVSRPLTRITNALTRLANGEQVDIPELHRRDEIGAIAKAAETFHSIAQQIEYEHWLSENVTILTSVISTENRIDKAAEQVLQLLCHLLNIPVGAIYLLAGDDYQRVSSQGLARSNQLDYCFQCGVGVLGQCAKDKQPIVLSPVPESIIIISSGLVEFPPHELVIYPIEHKGEVLALIELAATLSLSPKQHAFLKAAASALGLHFANLQAAQHNADLLEETRQQALELRASSSYARSLIEASLDPLVTIGIDGKIMDVNAATEKVTGVTREQLIGSDFCDYFTAPEQARQVYQQAFSKGFVTDYPLAIRHTEGNITDVLYNASVYLDSDGKVAGLFAAARDITDKKRAEEKMRQQQEALLQSNAEMQLISEEMRTQNEELKTNQEELRAQQEEALQKNLLLQVQSNQLKEVIAEAKNKADELEKANHYKSEFLANMSHELRTPLNSILILSKNLAENAEANLLPDQVESATVISESGTQLLTLINDILDLSKIEAGKLELVKESFALQDIATYLRRVFLPQSSKKSLDFDIALAAELPEHIYSDRQRLTQILSNLLTNAIKFTDSGAVKVRFSRVENDLNIEIIDSGIGIPPDKLEHIFGAFQQLDGSTSRKYGGSGLGLAISRNLAHLLGGDIYVSSQIGRGSCFSLRLTKIFTAQNPEPQPNVVTPSQDSAIPPTTGNILIVEDDQRLLALVSRMISGLGFQTINAESAEHALLKIHDTDLTGIFLDLGLPKMSGMDLLRQLKADKTTANIPIFIMSGAVDSGEAQALGALGFLQKPVTRDSIIKALKTMVQLSKPRPQILLIEDSRIDQDFVKNVLRDTPTEVIAVDTGSAGLQLLQSGHYAAVILDLQLPDISGFDWLKQAQAHLNPPPIIVYSARELTEHEVFELKGITESIVTKNALSDRLYEEVGRLLQRHDCPTPPPAIKANGKKLLLVDDDARNLYALTKVLKSKGFSVEVAPDSLTALNFLAGQAFDVLLTDIMMPQIDGYELIRRVRALGYETLPIIAITAKAMMGDDSLCLNAGATAYLAKPVDVDALIALLNRL